MPIKGTIEADYSKFEAECKKAETGLAKIETQGKATEQSLTSMENSVASGKVGDAIAKTVSSVDKVGASAKASASSFGQMSEGLKVADRTLNQFGVNLGPTIGSLDEFAKVSGKTSAQLGTLGTAASVAGAALAGWNIGRWIAEMTGSDKIIGDATASILGWRDAGQAAANNAAVLRRAFEVTGKTFTDVHAASEALRQSSRDQAAQLTTTSTLVMGWNTELQNAKGGLAALRGEIDAGNLTTQQLTARFKVSAEAIEYLKKQMGLAADETRKMAAADEKAAAEAQRHADAVTSLQASMFGTDKIAKAQEYLAALGGVGNLTRMSTEAQTSMNTELGKAIDAYTRMGQVAPQAIRDVYTATLPLPPIVAGLGAEWASVGEKVTVTTDSIVGDLKRQADAAKKVTADFEAETQRQVDAWNRGERATDNAKKKIDETTGSVQQLTVQMRQLTVQMTEYESAIAGAQLLRAYADAGVATSGNIGLGGYEFKQLQKTGVPGGWGGVSWADRTPMPTGAWGNQNTLTVNVNNATADDLANKLVGEMKHQGYRL
jgi:hypothetical protein